MSPWFRSIAFMTGVTPSTGRFPSGGRAHDRNVPRAEVHFHGDFRCRAGSRFHARAHCRVDWRFPDDSRWASGRFRDQSRGPVVMRGRRASHPVVSDDRRNGHDCRVALSGEFPDG